ncbi:MAG: hypothetical protein F4227_09850 [Gammaproteobacteria bacterium]|nr:hypothetical protein [Gammaproteobacteria bacterium]MYF03243.1 hypothetical protein [Gammaproteobacteria bacterium]MYI76881.1 hypothetical protein [Gammaproteobacteria bacterium]
MNTKQAQQILWKAVYELDATGSSGFEGFLANVQSELTGQTFHVVKSGSQGGSDVRSDPSNFVKIALESKQYNLKTKLSVGTLLHKLTEASRTHPPPDFWILASTREIDGGDREKLKDHGGSLGIDVAVWDWKNRRDVLCDLAVVCVSAANTCRSNLRWSTKLNQAFQLIEKHPDFNAHSSYWRQRLLQPDVGYTNCRKQCSVWLKGAQESLANARSRLGGHHNLSSSKYGVVRRNEINQQLQEWFPDRNAGAAALIGYEGMGKSWAVLDWCNELMQSTQTDYPLIVYLKAKSDISSDIKLDIAQKISTQVGNGTKEFWRRRLDLWERSGRDSVRLLIAVDGLNQNFLFPDWAGWVQPLLEDSVRGMYSVLFTSWQSFWRDELRSLANLTPNTKEIVAENFNDDELDRLLASSHVRKEELADEVLKLMRVPRLSTLVLKHREILAESGDVTPERVIYEDWKDRIDRNGQLIGLDDDRMKSFVKELGQQLQKNFDRAISRKNIVEILGRDSGKLSNELTNAVAHLTSGGWFTATCDPDIFKLNGDRVHYVLGASLTFELKARHGSQAVREVIADFLDPIRANSLGAQILRAATTIALVEEHTADDLKQALIERWLDEQNFSTDDFNALWRLAGLDPTLILGNAERIWLGALSDNFKDEVLIKTLANAAVFHNFNSELKSRLVEWLGTVWCEYSPNSRPQDEISDDEDSLEHKELYLIHSCMTDWSASTSASEFPTVRLQEDGDWSFLSHRALAVISYLNKVPFTKVFEAWALSRALMKNASHINDLTWVIQMNQHDPDKTNQALGHVIDRLDGQQHMITKEAASLLREALSHTKRGAPLRHVEILTCSNKVKQKALVTEELEGEELFNEVKKFLSPVGWKYNNATTGAALIDKLIVESGLPATGKELDLISNHFREIVTLITPKSRRLLSEACIHAQVQGLARDETRPLGAAKLGFMALILQLFEATTEKQYYLLLESDVEIADDEWCKVCHIPEANELDELNTSKASRARLNQWLRWVGKRLPKSTIQSLKFLPSLVLDEDVGVRVHAVNLASYGCHVEALKRFATSEYAAPVFRDDNSSFHEEHARNNALLSLESVHPEIVRTKSLADQSSVLRVKLGDHSCAAMDAFGKYLIQELKAAESSPSWSTRRYWFSYRECIELLFQHKEKQFIDEVGNLAKRAAAQVEHAFMTDFPIMDTMRALKNHAPKLAIAIFKELKRADRLSMFSTDSIDRFPFELPQSEDSDAMCEKLLSSATKDQQLLDIAYVCCKSQRIDWLLSHISSLEASTRPTNVARALTLLGFCDASSQSDALWKVIDERPPKDKWLSRVYRESRKDYARNVKVKEALKVFWRDNSEAVAWDAWQFVKDNCDIRVNLCFKEMLSTGEKLATVSRELSLDLGERSLKQTMKNDWETRKRKLFHTDLPISYMAPWHSQDDRDDT